MHNALLIAASHCRSSFLAADAAVPLNATRSDCDVCALLGLFSRVETKETNNFSVKRRFHMHCVVHYVALRGEIVIAESIRDSPGLAQSSRQSLTLAEVISALRAALRCVATTAKETTPTPERVLADPSHS